MIKKGFTLLELLVVIGIIAILVSLSAAAYSTIQKKARDAKRQGDLKAAQQTLEQCYSINNYLYPTGANFSISSGTITITCPADPTITISITDPLNTGTYIYTAIPATTSYSITADLESTTNFIVRNQQ